MHWMDNLLDGLQQSTECGYPEPCAEIETWVLNTELRHNIWMEKVIEQ